MRDARFIPSFRLTVPQSATQCLLPHIKNEFSEYFTLFRYMENVLVKSSTSDMMETFQRSESLKSANEIKASSSYYENAANEQKVLARY
ncbi:unnamed protein product [Brugia timori]|uniref:Uncharacterized protein n=1 Tax=Brugia timori TaxID=42155 RepID=A0A0R3QBG0_9BILA|nr:unnamed protein product [Brugia timori]